MSTDSSTKGYTFKGNKTPLWMCGRIDCLTNFLKMGKHENINVTFQKPEDSDKIMQLITVKAFPFNKPLNQKENTSTRKFDTKLTN